MAAIAYRSSVANEQGSGRKAEFPSSPNLNVRSTLSKGYWIVRLGRTLRYHAQMVYRVCEMLRAVLKQPNLEPSWPRAMTLHPMHTLGKQQTDLINDARGHA